MFAKQLPPKRALQKVQAQQGFIHCGFRVFASGNRPPRFDLPDTSDHDLVVARVWTAMEWHPGRDACRFSGGQQQPIAAEIIKAHPLASHFGKHGAKTAPREQLSGQQVMALQAGMVTRRTGRVDRTKGDHSPACDRTPRLHLFARHVDDGTIARRAQDQTRAVRGGDVIIGFETADKDKVVDQTDRQTSRSDPVCAQRWFDPQFLADPELEARALQGGILRLDEGGQPQRRKRTAIVPGRHHRFEEPPTDRGLCRTPSHCCELIEMLHHITRQSHHLADHRKAVPGRSQMWPRSQRHHLKMVRSRKFGQIEPMGNVGKGAFRPRSQATEIEGQPVAQQLKPVLLARPQRPVTGRTGIEGIMADTDRQPARRKGADRMPIGPFATGKQQVQLSVLGALRL